MTSARDLVVIGGGPGGYATALRAATRGLRATVVEAREVGGTCLHRGCVPSKALLHVAALAAEVPHLVDWGLAAPGPGLDLAAAGRSCNAVVDRLHRGLRALLSSTGVEVVEGWGRVVGPGEVAVSTPDGGERVIAARHVVVAVGSAPAGLPGVAVDGRRVIVSDHALTLERVPERACIIGAGAIGVEVATLWSALGSEVTMVEAADRPLPLEDPASSQVLQRALERRGRVGFCLGATVATVEPTRDAAVVELDDGSRHTADQVLVAVGRRPATGGAGLEDLDVLDDRDHVVVDDLGCTRHPWLWAVGDAVPGPALAHAAFAEGFVVADAVAGADPRPVDHDLVPRVTYSTPEVASVGLTEPAARARADGVATTTTSLAGNGRALIDGTGGQVKLVHAADGTLLGAHIVGPSATELIGEMGLAVAWGALAQEVADVVHGHPTVSESLREAALTAAGLPFHQH